MPVSHPSAPSLQEPPFGTPPGPRTPPAGVGLSRGWLTNQGTDSLIFVKQLTHKVSDGMAKHDAYCRQNTITVVELIEGAKQLGSGNLHRINGVYSGSRLLQPTNSVTTLRTRI